MIAASSSPVRSLDRSSQGAIRKAEGDDASGLVRLFDATGVAPPTLTGEYGHLLVFERARALLAAAYVRLDGPRARLQLLVVDPGVGAAARAIEDRLFGVVLALCNAYGFDEVDIAPDVYTSSVRSRNR